MLDVATLNFRAVATHGSYRCIASIVVQATHPIYLGCLVYEMAPWIRPCVDGWLCCEGLCRLSCRRGLLCCRPSLWSSHPLLRTAFAFASAEVLSQCKLTNARRPYCDATTQEIAYKEKRAGDVRDSWYIRPGFESLLDESLDHQHHSGEASPADADTKDRAKVTQSLTGSSIPIISLCENCCSVSPFVGPG